MGGLYNSIIRNMKYEVLGVGLISTALFLGACGGQEPTDIQALQPTPSPTSAPTLEATVSPINKSLEERLLPAIQEENLTLTDLYFEVAKEMRYHEMFQGQFDYRAFKVIKDEADRVMDYLSADVYRGLEADHVLRKSAHYSDFPEAVRDDLSDYKNFIEKAQSRFRSKTFKGALNLEEFIDDITDYVIENMPEDIKYSRQLELTQRLIEIYLEIRDNTLKNKNI